ncbi:MAG: FecR domain-containing protein [Gallionella sp.]
MRFDYLKDAMFLLRWTIRAAVALALLVAGPSWGATGYVHDANGDVTITQGKAPARAVLKNSIVTSNSLISTGEKSHAVLKFLDGQVVAMQANSVFNVREYRFEPKKAKKSNIIFSGIKGGFLFITGLIAKRNNKSFRLATPNATIGVRGTEFMVAMDNGALYGKVKAGTIVMTNDAGAAQFKAGQNILVSSPTVMPVTISAEELPVGIFSQFEAMQTSIDSATSDGGANVLDLPGMVPGAGGLVTGSALMSAAAMAAGGAIADKSLTLDVDDSLSASGIAALPVIMGKNEAESQATKGAASQLVQMQNATLGDRTLFGRHNLLPGRVGTGEICIFCHTPQGNEAEVRAPLWDRTKSTAIEYKAYSSIGSATAAATGSVSVACLSCHDGTQAPNVVINSPINNKGVYRTDKQLVQLSRDYLKGHHPVSILFGGGGVSHDKPDAPVDSLAAFRNINYEAMALRQVIRPRFASKKYMTVGTAYKENPVREIKEVSQYKKQDFNLASHSGSGSGTVWWMETNGTGNGRQKSDFYLYTRTDTVDGQIMNRPYVECSSCHDPHSTNTTFLRINNVGSAVCLTCHAK